MGENYIPKRMIEQSRFIDLYSNLPRAEFLYTQQIGTGGTMCDYTFRKR